MGLSKKFKPGERVRNQYGRIGTVQEGSHPLIEGEGHPDAVHIVFDDAPDQHNWTNEIYVFSGYRVIAR